MNKQVLYTVIFISIFTGAYLYLTAGKSEEIVQINGNAARKATKIEYYNCVHDKKCYSLNCDPSGIYAEDCLKQKNKYMHCAFTNEYCSVVPDILDVLLDEETMPNEIYECYGPDECGADSTKSFEYYHYQDCFKKCLWVDV